MKMTWLAASAVAGLLSSALPAFAQSVPISGGPISPQADQVNKGPPAGPEILDLSGRPLPAAYTAYSVGFTASSVSTVVTFAFRDDPAFLLFDNASVVDTTHPSGNLLVNPGFEANANTPIGWTYFDQDNVAFAGVVNTSDGAAYQGSNYWYDGAVGGYDGLSQTLATTLGDTYRVGFELQETSESGNFERLASTDDNSDGIDVVVYAGSSAPSTTQQEAVPEPASIAMLGMAFGGLTMMNRRRVLKPVRID